jgi:protein-disulfide isomerase
MKKSSIKLVVIIISAIVITAFAIIIINNYKNKTSFKYSKQTAEEIKPEQNQQDPVNKAVNETDGKTKKESDILKVLPSDYVLGSPDAKVTFIEYASLSCPHCSSFHREAFEKIKSEYIETGKIKFIFRSFPLNHPALSSAMLSICHARENKENPTDKYYATIKILFKTQDSWAFDQKFLEKLEAILKLDGMDSESFKKCINDKSLQDRILRDRMDVAKSLQIKSTPSFFINQEVSEGYVDYQTLQKIIEKKLAE